MTTIGVFSHSSTYNGESCVRQDAEDEKITLSKSSHSHKMIKVFGIKQCSTMQKAFRWLDTHKVPYEFHDYKKSGIDATTLAQWCATTPWESLINTRGTTWRKLDEALRDNIDQAKAIGLMVAQPSLIKRPVIVGAGELILGFDENLYAQHLEPSNA